MRRSSFNRFASCALIAGILVLLVPTSAAAPVTEHDLHLEVIVNGAKTGLIGAFRRREDGRLAVAGDEWRALGMKADARAAGTDGLIELDRLSGLNYRLDSQNQTIWIETGDGGRLPQVYDLRKSIDPSPGPAAATTSGAVLNYLLYASADSGIDSFFPFGRQFTAAANLDARLFGRLGVLSQTGIVGARAGDDFSTLRLDTTWTYSDPASVITYRGGDLISGGLAWTRPVRLGGIQVQRNFSLRPDLITIPMPGLSGSAAVPSTVDVYINNLRTFSRDLPAGPFEIRNLPAVSGPGLQRVVVRDALGRETVTDQAFYASPKLLRAGLVDFSLEAGLPRLDYGARSNEYAPDPVGSASLRGGLSDTLTLEFHAEGAERVVNASAGVVFPAGTIGVASLAVAGSNARGDSGAQVAASFEAGLGRLLFYVRTIRSFADFTDVAATVARSHLSGSGEPVFDFRPPKALDQISVSFPLGVDPTRVALAFTRVDHGRDADFRILSASASRAVGRNTSLFGTAFFNFGAGGGYGFYGGITRAFGQGISATASATGGSSGGSAGIDAVKSQPLEIGSYGWRVREREGSVPNRAAAVSYRAPIARLQGGVEQFRGATRASGEVEGAIAVAGGDVFLANRIDDGFAVVDAGAAGVDVLHENRPIGKTDTRGKLLVPNLKSYQRNRLAIDPKALPVDAIVETTKEFATPPDRGAAVVRFGVDTSSRSALVSFRNTSGRAIPAGSRGVLESTGENFVVGYDGDAFLHKLETENSARIEQGEGVSCRARFSFVPRPGTQVRVGPVPCI